MGKEQLVSVLRSDLLNSANARLCLPLGTANLPLVFPFFSSYLPAAEKNPLTTNIAVSRSTLHVDRTLTAMANI